MAYTPSEISELSKESDLEHFERRINNHLIERTRAKKIVGCMWGIPYEITSEDDPTLVELIHQFVKKGWYVKMGTASAPGFHLEIMEDPAHFNMKCSNIRVYDPTKENPMEDPDIWDAKAKIWKKKEDASV